MSEGTRREMRQNEMCVPCLEGAARTQLQLTGVHPLGHEDAILWNVSEEGMGLDLEVPSLLATI